ncbi:methyltransferase regulatory domain-containing protein [Rhizobium laguerreae]|uniref:methyltransferase regulatory domain-containing protein n=1 Tax=Rhizobium laguerreae TaxID=1076926 RepID=UPI001FEAB5F5|nr:methyltransferase regulatory domain-containing protein [Rhizobium laguerreae]
MGKQGRNYLGHEYMNAVWHLEHFSDMARSLDEAKLTYVGSARLLDGIDAFQLNEEGTRFVSQIGHPIMRETVRDFLVNRRFRTDIFAKGARPLPGREHRDAWCALAFVLVVPEIDVPKKIMCARGEVALPADKYDLILEALADDGYRPKRVEELLKHDKLRKLKPQDIVDLLTVLTGAGFAAPAQGPSETVSEQCRALNRHILQRALVSMDLHHMVSPVTGGGIGLNHMTQLFVLATTAGKEGRRPWPTMCGISWTALANAS